MNKSFKTKHRARSERLAKRREYKRTIKRGIAPCSACNDKPERCYCLAA